jgi:hypothetical protein
MGCIFISKLQIEFLVQTIWQPEASVLFHKAVNSYRGYLDSSDVGELFDRECFDGIEPTLSTNLWPADAKFTFTISILMNTPQQRRKVITVQYLEVSRAPIC